MIKTKAALNEEWLCFTTPELGFKAKIIAAEIENVLGTPDSVKTISFQAIDSNGQNISHEVNNLNLKLSKNFGILKTINFYSFPELNLGFLLQWLSEFTLIGFDNPETGIQNLTWKAVNDHNIGDELHTSGTTAYAYYYKYTETIEKVLDKTISGDSIIYNWENKVKISIQTPDSNTFTATVDTITQYITSNPEFDILPGVAWQLSSWGDFYNANMMYQGEHGPVKTFGNETNAVEKGTELFMGDTCYTPVIVCGCAADYTYYSGLGGPYYYCNMGIDQYIRELVYYKKDGIEWGTPIDFTVNSNLIPIEQKPELVTVFPNPASDLVNIVFKGNTGEYRLQIVDNSGRKIAEYSLKGEDNSIDLSSFKKGIFLLRILSENLTITKRLVKI